MYLIKQHSLRPFEDNLLFPSQRIENEATTITNERR
jgi:hypothetical protein